MGNMNNLNRRDFLAASALGVAALGATRRAAAQSGKKYRAGVIGDTKNGGYGHSMHHLWRLREDVECVALAEPDEATRADRASEAGAAKTYADYRDMLEKEDLDFVAIGPRWTTNHKQYLLDCAAAGVHGITEKPLTPSLAEADEAIAALDAKNLKWAIAFNFRASPVIPHAKKSFFEDKVIGEVLELRLRGKEDYRSGGEDMIVLGTHLFDLSRYLLGEAEWCQAEFLESTGPSEAKHIREAGEPLGPIIGSSVHARYSFGKGFPVHFDSTANADGNQGRWGIDLYGTKGIGVIRMDRVPIIRIWPSPTWAPIGKKVSWQSLPGAPEVPTREPESVGHYGVIIDDLIAAVEEDRRPLFSVHDGRAAHEFIQAAFASHIAGGERVAMPMTNREHPLANWKTS